MSDRPILTPTLGADEFRRWYWTLAELTAFARLLGVARGGGGKAALAERIAVVLDGGTPLDAPARRAVGRQLRAPVDGASVLPPGQRCSQVLRSYLTERIGPGFRFDAAMREFVAAGAGRTVDQLVAHWHATRGAAPPPIAAQFELNRFLREHRCARPGASHADALAAWREHRSRPRGERDPP